MAVARIPGLSDASSTTAPANTLAETMPVVTELLALDDSAHFTLESHIS